MAVFEGELGDTGLIEVAEAFGYHAIVLFFCGARERQIEAEIARELMPKILGRFIAAHSTPIALREGILNARVLQPALHDKLEQISKSEILRKLSSASATKP